MIRFIEGLIVGAALTKILTWSQFIGGIQNLIEYVSNISRNF